MVHADLADNYNVLVKKNKNMYKSKHNVKNQSYTGIEGNMLSKLKISNPRQCNAKFSKRKSKCNMPLHELFEHYKGLA
jgi:hypothetical protein